MSCFKKACISSQFVLAPDTLLTPTGPKSNFVLAVSNGEIGFVGSKADFCEKFPNRQITDLPGKAIMPGMIDSHIHLGQGFGKAIIGGEPSQIWRRIWVPLESNLSPEHAYISAKWMFLEALRGGFTGIVNFAVIDEEKTEAIHRAALETGIRLVSSTGGFEPVESQNFDGSKQTRKNIDAVIVRAEKHLKACAEHPNITPSLCVPGIQGASGDMIKALSEFCAENGALFQIHTNEHHVEVHWSIAKYGMRPLEFFAEHGGIGPHTLHHHCTIVTESEIKLLRDSQSGVSYNPLASVWKGDCVAPALAFSGRGVRMGMGTDSTRSDGFRLLECAETCQRISSGMSLADFSCGSAWTWVDAATKGSADVAGLNGITGELKAGLRADFLILDQRQPEVLPSWDFEWELVRLYNRDQISAVVIDGKLVMENGVAANWDQGYFLEEHLSKAVDVMKNAPIDLKHPVSSLSRPTNHKVSN